MDGTYLLKTHAGDDGRKPRICLSSWRRFGHKVFQCSLYEAEDVLIEAGEVDLICPEPAPHFRFRERLQRRLLYLDLAKALAFLNPGLQPVRLARDYDLFVAVCQNYWDLLYVNTLQGLRDRCKTSICWIDELWAMTLPKLKSWMHVLTRFDHVFVGLRSSVVPLSRIIGRPCHWLPGGVDALRFTPYPAAPRRVIDVYCVGRRWPGLHETLRRMADAGRIFYVHDTFNASEAHVFDYREHRKLLASMAKRSRFFIVGPAKIGCIQETRGQVEIGHRFFEGAAAGAVLIGDTAESETFRELFGWPGAMIPVALDGTDVAQVLTRFSSEPEEFDVISRRNASEALLRHDWVYRWKRVFEVAGVAPPSGLAARERRLRELVGMSASGATH